VRQILELQAGHAVGARVLLLKVSKQIEHSVILKEGKEKKVERRKNT
jgi:hypothetical protein